MNSWHLDYNQPLKDYSGEELTIESWDRCLRLSNLSFLKKSHSLAKQVKERDQLPAFYKKLNKYGRGLGITSGAERVVEIAKILFIKMLVDNDIYLSPSDWNYLVTSKTNEKLEAINRLLGKVNSQGIEIMQSAVNKDKNNILFNIVEDLNVVNFNNQNYDVIGSLFEDFLAERAGGQTNDLGQYFTPPKIISLIYQLSKDNGSLSVYDPYCGTGGILLQFFNHNASENQDYAEKSLFGNEISTSVALLAKMNMVLAGDGHSNIDNTDSLSSNNAHMSLEFDCIATNMPFDPAIPINIPDNYLTMSRDSSHTSKFIEHCVNRCKQDGRILIITSKGFLTEKQSAEFRKRLISKYDLEAVYTLYEGLFLPYTAAFSCLLVINKRKPREFTDFYSVESDEGIDVVANHFDKTSRYNQGFYRVATSELLDNVNVDLRGLLYQSNANDSVLRLKDLVEYIEPKRFIDETAELKKMTTPNSIKEGINLINTQANKRLNKQGSFIYRLEKGAIVVARITNKRVDTGRYLGSALVDDACAGHLITREYHQLRLKDPANTYLLLYFLRTKRFQQIVELASGTAGQQRIHKDILLDYPISIKINKGARQKAQQTILEIELRLKKIANIQSDLSKIANPFLS